MCLAGCDSLRQVPAVKESTHDTLYLNKIQFDSIYVDNWHQIDHSNDTVVIREIQRENRYRFLRDTVRVVKIDSIPIIREVEVVKTERYVPKVYKASFWICIVLFCVLCAFCVLKIKP